MRFLTLLAALLPGLMLADSMAVTAVRGAADIHALSPGSVLLFHCRTAPACFRAVAQLEDISAREGAAPCFSACFGSDEGVLMQARRFGVHTIPAFVMIAEPPRVESGSSTDGGEAEDPPQEDQRVPDGTYHYRGGGLMRALKEIVDDNRVDSIYFMDDAESLEENEGRPLMAFDRSEFERLTGTLKWSGHQTYLQYQKFTSMDVPMDQYPRVLRPPACFVPERCAKDLQVPDIKQKWAIDFTSHDAAKPRKQGKQGAAKPTTPSKKSAQGAGKAARRSATSERRKSPGAESEDSGADSPGLSSLEDDVVSAARQFKASTRRSREGTVQKRAAPLRDAVDRMINAGAALNAAARRTPSRRPPAAASSPPSDASSALSHQDDPPSDYVSSDEADDDPATPTAGADDDDAASDVSQIRKRGRSYSDGSDHQRRPTQRGLVEEEEEVGQGHSSEGNIGGADGLSGDEQASAARAQDDGDDEQEDGEAGRRR
ncbi:hypothetical protein JKP88DRAFT_272814 [Tribonema minus]|uniref:Uncharacterized protein n=1 Tax=Tribonema minus TaxID=303371 RepID=A0A836CDW1_9STRA|nr:hypothetical protein JKP88DRAFT_272814 [Tribonema minus]